MWPFNKSEKDLSKESDKRCIPVARTILEKIGTYENKIFGSYTQKEANIAYKELVQDIKTLMLENDLMLNEVNYVMKMILQPIDAIKYILTENLNHSLSEAQDKFWGKDHEYITLEDLDEQLKK